MHPAAVKGLATLDREWAGLARHREFPELPLDNNGAERALRGPVVGRKNFYGSGSKTSAELASRVWTITATTERAGLNPLVYLGAYLHACAQSRRHTTHRRGPGPIPALGDQPRRPRRLGPPPRQRRSRSPERIRARRLTHRPCRRRPAPVGIQSPVDRRELRILTIGQDSSRSSKSCKLSRWCFSLRWRDGLRRCRRCVNADPTTFDYAPLTVDPLLAGRMAASTPGNPVVGLPGGGRSLRDQGSPGIGQGCGLPPARRLEGRLGVPIEPALDRPGDPLGRQRDSDLAHELNDREQRPSGDLEVAVRVRRGHVLGEDLHEPQQGQPVQMMVNALRAKPPVISVDENGMTMNSGSMRMVAVVQISATNSWRAASQPARSEVVRSGYSCASGR